MTGRFHPVAVSLAWNHFSPPRAINFVAAAPMFVFYIGKNRSFSITFSFSIRCP